MVANVAAGEFSGQQIEYDAFDTCRRVITQINSKGIWSGDNPFAFSVPLLLFQLVLISFSTRSLYFLLKPFGQPSIVSQILGGVILGPSFLGRTSFMANVFPDRFRTLFDTLALFGFMLSIFLIGVQIDPFIVLKSRKRTVVIGSLGFFIPFMVTGFVVLMVQRSRSLDLNLSVDLPMIAALVSMTPFAVITCFLAELKILNSEIGRLASSSSLICDFCSWSMMLLKYMVTLSSKESLNMTFGSFFSVSLLVVLILFGIRPAALWAARTTPEGKPVKEIYVLAVFIALLSCAFIAEAVGLNAFVASFLLGLVIPAGPPLGATLVERLDCFVTNMLMPLFFTMSGLKMDIFSINSMKNVGLIQLIVLASFLAKFFATAVPLLMLRTPLRDAISLGLIMNSKGIIEFGLLNSWKIANVMNEECFAVTILSLVVVTGVISALVKILYKPSRRFVAYKRRTILHNRNNEELRILTCIHNEFDVQAALNLLGASNPSQDSPINLFVLHLMKLVGRASSLLTSQLPHEKTSSSSSSSSSQNKTQTDRVFAAFQKFEQKYQGSVTLHCYKGVSPYSTMHNDVCSLALEKRITLIVIPFHKQWKLLGKVETLHAFRHLNQNVLDKAPCSVGILIDHSNKKKHFRALHSSYYRIGVLFFGGADDREALAYARRTAGHSHVLLNLIKFKGSSKIVSSTERSKALDDEILEEFRSNSQRHDSVSYQEVEVMDKTDVLDMFKSMEGGYDLVMVGRRHGESHLMEELRKHSRREDLGAVGDVLASSDFNGGSLILVVQQQTRVWGLRDPSEESMRLRRANP